MKRITDLIQILKNDIQHNDCKLLNLQETILYLLEEKEIEEQANQIARAVTETLIREGKNKKPDRDNWYCPMYKKCPTHNLCLDCKYREAGTVVDDCWDQYEKDQEVKSKIKIQCIDCDDKKTCQYYNRKVTDVVIGFLVEIQGCLFGDKHKDKPALKTNFEIHPDRFQGSWQECVDYAEKLGKGWRMPTRSELVYIYDEGLYSDTTYWYWSSTTYASSTTNAWGVHFSNGGTSVSYKTDSSYVRCVRDIPPKTTCKVSIYRENRKPTQDDVDWSRVKVDTTVLVRDHKNMGDDWHERHFIRVEEDKKYKCNAVPNCNFRNAYSWDYIKLPEHLLKSWENLESCYKDEE